MLSSLTRITLGRLSSNPLSRVTIGHIGIDTGIIIPPEEPVLSKPSGTGYTGLVLPYREPEPTTESLYLTQALREDKEILDIIVSLTMSDLL